MTPLDWYYVVLVFGMHGLAWWLVTLAYLKARRVLDRKMESMNGTRHARWEGRYH
jgi:hypothetical protein